MANIENAMNEVNLMKRRIGQFEVNAIGLGCMNLSHAYGYALDKKEAIKTIREAYRFGYDFFDTAEFYVGRTKDGKISINEEIVGEGVKPFRDKIVLATKFGIKDGFRLDSSEEAIRDSLNHSLKRLQTDHIDLYYQHRIDPNVPPERVALTMKKLIAEGRIREWGISEVDEDYLRRADKICHVSAIQNRYSMMARGYEHMFRICEELGTAYVAFSPLANGYLTGIKGTIDPVGDYRNFMPQYSYKGYEMNKKLLIFLSSLAEEKHCSMAQLSLAWMIEKHDNLIAIPGSKNIERIKENFESQNVHLTKEEIEKIDDFLGKSNFVVFGQ